MDQGLDKKLDLKERMFSFIKNHKLKLLFFILASIIFTICFFVFIENVKKKNIFISEKYVKAGLLLSNSQNDEAIKYYEDIILSKNKFYSILALNIILEKNLVTDNKIILSYFKLLEKENYPDELNDVILFKKALYLLKRGDIKTGEEILNFLINKNSNLKSLAIEVTK